MRLAYDDEGTGPVVVLLHGFPLHRAMWSPQLGAVGSTYRVIAPDLRGFGGTPAPAGVYTMDALADDLIETLDALGLTGPVALGGLSMGGYVAFAAVHKAPERFRALILLDTKAAADSPEASRSREALAAQVEASGDVSPVVEAMLPRLFSPMTRANRPELIDPVRTIMLQATPRAVVGALRGMAVRPDRTVELAAIRVPTLVVVGADDVISPPDEARAIASAIPGARLVVVPDAGHLAPLENPAVANAALLSFLDSLN